MHLEAVSSSLVTWQETHSRAGSTDSKTKGRNTTEKGREWGRGSPGQECSCGTLGELLSAAQSSAVLQGLLSAKQAWEMESSR